MIIELLQVLLYSTNEKVMIQKMGMPLKHAH